MIKRALKEKGLSAKEAAEKAKIDRSLVERYRDGKVRCGGKNAPKLATVLDLDLGELLSAA